MKGFFAGALFAAPITAIVMWLVVGMHETVDTKVERSVAASDLAEAEFIDAFDSRWQQMGGESLKCDPASAVKLAELRDKVETLNAQLDGMRAAGTERAKSLDEIVVSTEEK